MAATNHAQELKNDSKLFITEALLQLLSNAPFSSITVSQVCARAGVSRMAFYRNFSDLDQVLYEYYKANISLVFDAVHYETQEDAKYDAQLKFFNSFNSLLLLSFERGYEAIIQRIFVEEIEKFYAACNDGYWTTFMSAGAYAVWRKWLLEGQGNPLEEMVGFFKKLVAMGGNAGTDG
ncbi:MAG: TetR/AcrR family transcriptional regulator [Clostridiales bacterium]|jgi:AcrR family transcriptional regulator|nr:TetR/AcrR family transcriptional regulator [Clostridiales bacterium]